MKFKLNYFQILLPLCFGIVGMPSLKALDTNHSIFLREPKLLALRGEYQDMINKQRLASSKEYFLVEQIHKEWEGKGVKFLKAYTNQDGVVINPIFCIDIGVKLSSIEAGRRYIGELIQNIVDIYNDCRETRPFLCSYPLECTDVNIDMVCIDDDNISLFRFPNLAKITFKQGHLVYYASTGKENLAGCIHSERWETAQQILQVESKKY